MVVITDGRSQDEVKNSATKLQQAGSTPGQWFPQRRQITPEKRCSLSSLLSAGYSVFAIGVADMDFNELQEIATKPSERHVFVVDDFDAFDTIKENLINFICETATSCKWAELAGRRAAAAFVLTCFLPAPQRAP